MNRAAGHGGAPDRGAAGASITAGADRAGYFRRIAWISSSLSILLRPGISFSFAMLYSSSRVRAVRCASRVRQRRLIALDAGRPEVEAQPVLESAVAKIEVRSEEIGTLVLAAEHGPRQRKNHASEADPQQAIISQTGS